MGVPTDPICAGLEGENEGAGEQRVLIDVDEARLLRVDVGRQAVIAEDLLGVAAPALGLDHFVAPRLVHALVDTVEPLTQGGDLVLELGDALRRRVADGRRVTARHDGLDRDAQAGAVSSDAGLVVLERFDLLAQVANQPHVGVLADAGRVDDGARLARVPQRRQRLLQVVVARTDRRQHHRLRIAAQALLQQPRQNRFAVAE